MIFSAMTFLYLLPLAVLPVVFHFLLRQKRKKLMFSTLMFFHRTDPRLHRRQKLRRILLLICRMLLIAFLLLALSRPMIQGNIGSDTDLPVVIIIDNSASMAGPADSGHNKLQLAIDGARNIINTLPENTQAGIMLTVDDEQIPNINSLTTDRLGMLAALDSITPTAATGSPAKAINKADRLLTAGPVGAGMVHVFTDMQDSEFARAADFKNAASLETSLVLHRIATVENEISNISIKNIQLPNQRILPNHTYYVGVVLQNQDYDPVTVQLRAVSSTDEVFTHNITLGRKQISTVPIELTPEAPGAYTLDIKIAGDGCDYDNHGYAGLLCDETAGVIFLGSALHYGALPNAISPTGKGLFTGLRNIFVAVDDLGKQITELNPIMIVSTYDIIAQLHEQNKIAILEDFVKRGNNLLIVPSTRYNLLAKPDELVLPPAFNIKLAPRQIYSKPIKLAVLDKKLKLWQPFRSQSGSVDIGIVAITATHFLKLDDSWVPLLGLDYSKAILAQRQIGDGHLYICGSAFDSNWNSLPTTPAFVVLAQQLALQSATFTKSTRQDQNSITITAGQGMPAHLAENLNVKLSSLAGSSVNYSGPADKAPAILTPAVILHETAQRQIAITVKPCDLESSSIYLSDTEAQSFAGSLGQTEIKVVNYSSELKYSTYQSRRRHMDLFVTMLILATVAFIAEGLFANPSTGKAENAPVIDTDPQRRQGK
ncbi:MAG: BatA and WFA domain-containing protein [Phycisphaerae bacterium]|nr:BatA and WFA domain-containing protein [Phycisphaerae bacterium]